MTSGSRSELLYTRVGGMEAEFDPRRNLEINKSSIGGVYGHYSHT